MTDHVAEFRRDMRELVYDTLLLSVACAMADLALALWGVR